MRPPSARLRPSLRLRLEIAPSRFVVLCAGATAGPIAPRDGIDTVILACAMLRQRHGVDAMLIVIGAERGSDSNGGNGGDSGGDSGARPAHCRGEDPELARLHHLARELDVARHVRFAPHPPQAALADYHAAADVFASTPWHASPAAASAVARAMACALPVVCTAVGTAVGAASGAIAAMVRDGVTGYLLPPRDPETLCRCLARLQRQPLLARSMGMAGQAHASATPHRKTFA